VPDCRSIEGTKRVLELATAATADDLVIALISGGGSSLLTCPAGGDAAIGLKEVQDTTAALLGSGATIHEMNKVRACLDTVKGGGLARAAWPARLVTLILSDVIGDDLSTIATGPTVIPRAIMSAPAVIPRAIVSAPAVIPRSTASANPQGEPADSWAASTSAATVMAKCAAEEEALAVLNRFSLRPPAIPQSVLDHLTAIKPVASVTAGPGPDYGTVQIVANNSIAAGAFAAACPDMNATLLTLAAEGDAAEVGRLLVRIARHKAEAAHTAAAGAAGEAAGSASASAPVSTAGIVVLMAGETTVRLPAVGCGSGGRNQHMALAAALELEAWEADAQGKPAWAGGAALAQGAVFVAVGTDGTDGPTDAAGGIVTSRSAAAARVKGCDVRRCLERCDAFSALEAAGIVTMGDDEAIPSAGGLLKTGPTGTNVMDIYAVFVPFRLS
jgi:hydroxypyruvate reductase